MEEDDDVPEPYRSVQPDHHRLLADFAHFDAFPDLPEFSDTELLHSLPSVFHMEPVQPTQLPLEPQPTQLPPEPQPAQLAPEPQPAEPQLVLETEAVETRLAVETQATEKQPAVDSDAAEPVVEKVIETESVDVALEMQPLAESQATVEGEDVETARESQPLIEPKQVAVKSEEVGKSDAEATETEGCEDLKEGERDEAVDPSDEREELEVAEDVELETAEAMEGEAEKEEMETAAVEEDADAATNEEWEADAAKEASETDMLMKDGMEMDAYKEASEADVAAELARPRKGGGKRKRGRAAPRAPSRAPPKKKEEEDVCFICFDGGNLVLCDRRGCPKAYHPSCVNRDEAFFRARGRWNCGWHICSQCQKSAQYLCYTCTFSLCKGCIKEAAFVCVRGNKGLCSTCLRTVTMIEQNLSANKKAEVDFDDKSNWEYLFKDYWLDLKGKLSITSEELASAKNPTKGSGVAARNEESSGDLYDANNDHGLSSDSSVGHNEINSSAKRKKAKKRLRSSTQEESSSNAKPKKSVSNDGLTISGDSEWASNELLELVTYMKNGDKSVLSQYEVQELLLEYIKRNNLRDPRRKSQIICDIRLQNLFGKPRVGHFEMLKLLESHFFIKDAPDDAQGGVLDNEVAYVETESYSDATKSGSDKKRKTRKRVEEREQQTNLDDYAAIDVHNINLVYLKRNLMEDLIDDIDKFQDSVVGSFVRIRISGASQKQDMYRLVQVVGTGKAAEAYKSGKKTTDITLEILNLNKTEVITIDTISNQEFTEEECKRLRQSIKCGLISRLTVGEIYEKAKAVQAVRVKDWLDSEVLRLSHLRDRASEHGRRKDLRECVEKLELLNTPEERARRLQELPEVHADPNMDPSYISDDEDDLDDRKQAQTDDYSRRYTRKGRDQNYSGKGGSVSNDGWNGARKGSSVRWEPGRNVQTKGTGWDKGDTTVASGDRTNESLSYGRDVHQSSSWDSLRSQGTVTSLESGGWNCQQPNSSSASSPNIVPETPSAPSAGIAISANVSETDKIWHYKDPSGKIQGPFNMTQLRKWSKTGYFPSDLRIWKTSEKQEDSLLLTDALVGKFHKENASVSNGNAAEWVTQQPSLVASRQDTVNASSQVLDPLKDSNSWSSQSQNHAARPTTPSLSGGRKASRWDLGETLGTTIWNTNRTLAYQSSSVQPLEGTVLPATPTAGWKSDPSAKNDSSNLPTPTPKPSSGGWTAGQGPVNVWSASAGPVQANNSGWAASSTSGVTGHSNVHPLPLVNGQQKASEHDTLHSITSSAIAELSHANLKPQLNVESKLTTPINEASMPTNSQGPDAPSATLMRLVDHTSHNDNIMKSQVSGIPVSESLPSKTIVGQSNINTANWSAASIGQAGGPSGWGVGSNAAAGSIQINHTSANTWKPGSAMEPTVAVNTGWCTTPTEIPNAGRGTAPDNSNQGWAPAKGNSNVSWGVPQQGNAGTVWGAVAPGNAGNSWGASVPGNTNIGNINTSWGATTQGNTNVDSSGGGSNAWGSHQKHSGERFSGQGDRSFRGDDSGHSGRRPWSRASGGGGPSSRAPSQGNGICRFHENGYCKKGASCNYLHT